MKKNSVGFSLIELLIVMVIIGILTVIGIPIYQDQMHKTHRNNAMATLEQFAGRLENYHLTNHTYVGVGIFPITIDQYTYSVIGALGTNTYTIRATPVVGSAQDGTGLIQLTETGAKWWDKNNDTVQDAGESDWN